MGVEGVGTRRSLGELPVRDVYEMRKIRNGLVPSDDIGGPLPVAIYKRKKKIVLS